MPSKSSQNLKKLLVFRFSSLGDVALTVPVIHSVLEQNPHVFIDFVTPEFMHALFPKHERLQLHAFDKKKEHKGIKGLYNLLKSFDLEQYEAIVDLHDVLRTKVLSTLSKLKGKKVVTIHKDRKSRKLLIQGKVKTPLKHTTEKYADVFRELELKVSLKNELHDFLKFGTEKKLGLGIAPFARHQGKMYDISRMEEVVKSLSKNYALCVFGSKDELAEIKHWDDIENVHLVKNLGLVKELELISELQLMISMDSANMHLASLVGVPVVSVWGVTHPNAGFLGYGQSMENVIQDESLSWRPTSIYGNKLGTDDNPNGMLNITPQMIIDKAETILNL